MEKNCVAAFYIQLSNNATLIPLPENDLINLVRTYRYFSRRNALEVLFRFKYGTLESKKRCVEWFSHKSVNETEIVYLDNLSSKFDHFNDEQFCLLADELQLQYQAIDTLFLDVHSIKGLPNGCQKELNELKEKMTDAPLLFFMAVKKCVKARKNSAVTEWIVELLSNDSTSQITALGNLGFDFNYRLLLKPFAKEIGSLLLSMRQIYVKRMRLLTSQDALALPLVTVLKQMIDLDIQVNMYVNKDTLRKKYHHSNKVALFESNVMKFIEVSSDIKCDNPRFNTFVECQRTIEELGKAIISLLQAQIKYKEVFSEEKNEGILFAAATDITLSQKMCLVQKSYMEAKVVYHSALENFQKFLLEHFEGK